MKRFIIQFIISVAVILGLMAIATHAAPITLPPGGGTGISSTIAGNNNLCLIQTNNSPFTYGFATCGTGAAVSFRINGQPWLTTTTIEFQQGSNVTITSSTTGVYTIAATGGGGAGSISNSSPFSNGVIPIETGASTLGNSSLSEPGGGVTSKNSIPFLDGNADWIGNNVLPSGNSTIAQNTTGTASLGGLIFGGGISAITTSTYITGGMFCAGGDFDVINTPGNATITITSAVDIASSSCGSQIFSGQKHFLFVINDSTNTISQVTSGTGESILYSAGSPSILQPGQKWEVLSEFQNSSTLPGATATGTMINFGTTLFQTSTPLTLNGNNILVTGNIIVGTAGADTLITSPGTALTLQQTGDQYGTTGFTIENRGGLNGAKFSNSGIDLVDFIFCPSSNVCQNIRFEHRAGALNNTQNGGGEFQIGPGGAANLILGTVASEIKTGSLAQSGGLGINTASPIASVDDEGTLFVDQTSTLTGLIVSSTVIFTGSSTVITPSIGGAIIGLGCDTATSSIDSSVISSTAAFVTTPRNNPGSGFEIYSFLLSTGVLQTNVCSDVTATPNSTDYVVKIIN